MYFQWRASVAGAEKFHSAMLPHARHRLARVWQETVRFGGELRRLAELAGSRLRGQVAVVLDWESWWALELDEHPSARMRWWSCSAPGTGPVRGGVNADFAHPESDLSGYRLVLVPGALPGDRRRRGQRAPVRGRRRHGADELLLRDRGLPRPDPAGRVPGAVAGAARPAGGGVRAAARAGGWPVRLEGRRRAAERRAGGAGRVWQDVIDLRGADPLLRYAEGHLAGQGPRPGTRTAGARRSTSARCRTGRPCAAGRRGLPSCGHRVQDRYPLRRGGGQARRYLFVISHLDHPVELDLGGQASTC